MISPTDTDCPGPIPPHKPTDPAVASDASWWLRFSTKALVRCIRLLGQRWFWSRALFPTSRCFFDVAEHPRVRRRVALTIDDAFCGGNDRARLMLDEVLALLGAHDARATFMTITGYARGLRADELARLHAAGHELGNHMAEEAQYDRLDQRAFAAELARARDELAALTGGAPQTRWFRAPDAKFSRSMAAALAEHECAAPTRRAASSCPARATRTTSTRS